MTDFKIGDRVTVDMGDGIAPAVVARKPNPTGNEYWDAGWWLVFPNGNPAEKRPVPFEGNIHPDRMTATGENGPVPEIHEFVLTDGDETGAIRRMTDEQAETANIEAERATGGNWYWTRYDELMRNRRKK